MQKILYQHALVRGFLFFIALTILAALPVYFVVQQPQAITQVIGKIFPTPTPRPELVIKGIGVIGDSLSDEYQADDKRGYEYAPTTINWIEQLVKTRQVNFGMWNTWGDVRRTGFEYNWSQSGATTASAISNGQHTGLAGQIADGDITIAIVYIGANDFGPQNRTDGYLPIYNGEIAGAALEKKVTLVVSNMKEIVDTLQEAGNAKVVLVTIPDWNKNMVIQLANRKDEGRRRVSDAIAAVNTQLFAYGKQKGLVVIDANAFYGEKINSSLFGSFRIGSEDVSVLIPGDEPHNALLSDLIHPGTIVNGLFANYIVEQLNAAVATRIIPLAEDDILKNAGLK